MKEDFEQCLDGSEFVTYRAMTETDWRRMQIVLMKFPDAMETLSEAGIKVRKMVISQETIEDVRFSTDCPDDRYGQHKFGKHPDGGDYCCSCGYRP